MKDEFFEIYDETYPIVVRYVVSKIDNISNVNDIVQNIYMNFYKTFSKKRNYIENYKYFIIDLSKKEMYKYYRFREKTKNNMLEIDFSELQNIIKSPEIIEIDFINKQNREKVWSEVKKMELVTQQILVLHYLEELSIKDVAKILELNENTVKTKIYRSISILKERIGASERDS